MPRLHCVTLSVAILAIALTTAPAVAQTRPEPPDSLMATSLLASVVAGHEVRELDSGDEARRATFGERLGITALVTAIGAGLGYSWWHSCNDPESDAIFSCIVAPRRLGSSVRFGTYTGLAVGLIVLASDMKVVQRNALVRAAGSGLLVDHDARSGFRVGANFRF